MYLIISRLGYMNLYNDEIKCTQLVDKIFKSADVDRSGTLDYTGIYYYINRICGCLFTSLKFDG